MRPGNFARILAVSLALAVYLGWVLTLRRATPPSQPVSAPTIDTLPLLRLAEARALWDQPSTLFLDVRPETDYHFGRIAGALHLPEEEIEKRLPALRARLARAGAIVVYCKSKDCGKSLWAAIRLRQAGLLQTRIYPGGWNEWVNSGGPTAGSGR